MRVLLDTNILIHRETGFPISEDIGRLFYWLDKTKAEKITHPKSIWEIEQYSNEKVKKAFSIKLENYVLLKTDIPLGDVVKKEIVPHDNSVNDEIDTILLNEVFQGRVDLLITEDRGIHRKAEKIGIDDYVNTIEEYVEKSTLKYPRLIDYKVLSVRKEYFGNVDIKDPFFDSFKEDYKEFGKWFIRKSDEIAYVCYTDSMLSAFLYLKIEEEDEKYFDFSPLFKPKRRLKIGTFKVTLNGLRLGERFLKIVFDHALINGVDEIYVTIFPKRHEQIRLINLLERWGFNKHGQKSSQNGTEDVYIRDFGSLVFKDKPKRSFPFFSKEGDPFFVPIWPDYHTKLLPDSILNTESPMDFKENKPVMNAIRKSYISHSYERNLNPGDIIFFYRTGGYYKGVISTLGIVEKVHKQIPSLEKLVEITRKRTVLSDKLLKDFWERYDWGKPFVVDFLYSYSLPKRPTLKDLIDSGIIKDTDNVPRGFHKLTWDEALTIIKLADGKQSLVVN